MGARRSLLALLALASLLVGCESDLPKATEIARMRVLGARFEVRGDPERATPAPGERVEISMATVFPDLTADLSAMESMLIGCTAPTRYTGGLPICQELVDAIREGQDPTEALPMGGTRVSCADLPERFQLGTLSLHCLTGEPRLAIDVPRDFDHDALLVRGVVCEHGSPFIDPKDPRLFGCEDEHAEAILVHGTVPVRHEPEDENHNPDIDALEVLRENVPWPPYDPEALPPEEGCENSEHVSTDFSKPVHSVVPGAHEITLRYAADARERVEGEPENVEITVYTTAGEMERRFTVFLGSESGEDGVLQSSLDWDPPSPADLPPMGQLVRFFITVRDQRGGFAMTSRAVCVR